MGQQWCPHCSRSFARVSHLRRHVLGSHPGLGLDTAAVPPLLQADEVAQILEALLPVQQPQLPVAHLERSFSHSPAYSDISAFSPAVVRSVVTAPPPGFDLRPGLLGPPPLMPGGSESCLPDDNAMSSCSTVTRDEGLPPVRREEWRLVSLDCPVCPPPPYRRARRRNSVPSDPRMPFNIPLKVGTEVQTSPPSPSPSPPAFRESSPPVFSSLSLMELAALQQVMRHPGSEDSDHLQRLRTAGCPTGEVGETAIAIGRMRELVTRVAGVLLSWHSQERNRPGGGDDVANGWLLRAVTRYARAGDAPPPF